MYFEPRTPASSIKIKDLRPGVRHVQVEGRVLQKEIVSRSAKPLAKALISDETGEITLNLWRDQIEQAKVGDTIRITDGFVKVWAGKLELSTWAKIEVVNREQA